MTYADDYSLRLNTADFLDVADAVDGIVTAGSDSWYPVDESWSYASASTITVPTGATSRFQVGDKLKLDNTSTKYFYIAAVASTTITIAVNDTYVVSNLAITNIYVSRAERPLAFPDSFSFTPTYGSAGGSFGSTSTTRYQYSLKGLWCNISMQGGGTLSSAVSAYLTFTVPFAGNSSGSTSQWIPGVMENAGAAEIGAVFVNTASATARAYRAAFANWTVAAGHVIKPTFTYQVAA